MRLTPVVASYIGLQKSIEALLSEDHNLMIGQLLHGKAVRADLNQGVLSDLLDMHVVAMEGDRVRLDTAVFLEDDIIQINGLASLLARGLAIKVLDVGSELAGASPQIRNFLGAIVGIGQGTHMFLKESSMAVDWKKYTGRFASTKVDFDEVCSAQDTLGIDVQRKSVHRGELYTAVTIGLEGTTYLSYLAQVGTSQDTRAYRFELMKYMTDSYGLLLAGRIESASLRQSAEIVGLFANGEPQPILVDSDTYKKHAPVVKELTRITCQHYAGLTGCVIEALGNTRAGKQGVPVENMMMHFWRYCRRALAKELYCAGFLTDEVPEKGSIVVFYDNSIEELHLQF